MLMAIYAMNYTSKTAKITNDGITNHHVI